MATEYERDEFDEIAEQRGPVGVHRAPRSVWSRIWPPLLVFVLAGLAAYGLATFFWNQRSSEPEVTSSPTASVVATPESSASPSVSASPTPSPTPTETEEPDPVIIYDAQVHVRNGAGVGGLAGTNQTKLTDAGYTNTAANNISSSLIPGGSNVVIYSEERLADTAQDVARVLGISRVEQGTTPGGAEIEALLASDPDA